MATTERLLSERDVDSALYALDRAASGFEYAAAWTGELVTVAIAPNELSWLHTAYLERRGEYEMKGQA